MTTFPKQFNTTRINLINLSRPKGTQYLNIINLFKTHSDLTKADIADLLHKRDLKRPGYYSKVFRSLTHFGILKYDRSAKVWNKAHNFDQFQKYVDSL